MARAYYVLERNTTSMPHLWDEFSSVRGAARERRMALSKFAPPTFNGKSPFELFETRNCTKKMQGSRLVVTGELRSIYGRNTNSPWESFTTTYQYNIVKRELKA